MKQHELPPERIKALKQKHTALEEQIKQEEKRPNPDHMLTSSIKKQKLKLKEQIVAARR